MAHSNRQKLRDARGGMTKNQARKQKAGSGGTSQTNRLHETIKWMESIEEKKRLEELNKKKSSKKKAAESTEPAKVVKYAKDKKSKERRKAALDRLIAQLKIGTKLVLIPNEDTGVSEMANINLTEADIKRMKAEMKVLESRI